MQVADGKVVSFHYDLKDVSGDLVESSREGDPITYLHGQNNIIRGLENALFDKTKGELTTVTLSPEEGYGLRQENTIQRIPLKHIHLNKREKPQAGLVVLVDTEHGPRQVTIVKAGKFSADVDTNHPLAGKTLVFDLEVIDIRDASDEEKAHGHVHGVGGHHH